MKATNTIVSALGDVTLSVSMNQGEDRFSTIELSNSRFASTRASSLSTVHSVLFRKRNNGREDMAQYIYEFQQLFAQLERMGSNAVSEEL